MALRIDHNKFHEFIKNIYQYLPDGRIVWHENGHCNICAEISQPIKLLEKFDFIQLYVVFVGRLNYLLYLKKIIKRNDNAGLFLEDLFVGLYVETITGINQHAPDLLKELEIEYDPEEFRKINELRNSAFHFPDDAKLFYKRRVEFNEYAKAKIHPFNENTFKLIKYLEQLVNIAPEIPELKAAFIFPEMFDQPNK